MLIIQRSDNNNPIKNRLLELRPKEEDKVLTVEK